MGLRYRRRLPVLGPAQQFDTKGHPRVALFLAASVFGAAAAAAAAAVTVSGPVTDAATGRALSGACNSSDELQRRSPRSRRSEPFQRLVALQNRSVPGSLFAAKRRLAPLPSPSHRLSTKEAAGARAAGSQPFSLPTRATPLLGRRWVAKGGPEDRGRGIRDRGSMITSRLF